MIRLDQGYKAGVWMFRVIFPLYSSLHSVLSYYVLFMGYDERINCNFKFRHTILL